MPPEVGQISLLPSRLVGLLIWEGDRLKYGLSEQNRAVGPMYPLPGIALPSGRA